MRALSQTDLIVVDRSQAALDHAREWGADHTLVVLARRKALKLATTTFDLTQVNEALGALRAGKLVGRGLLVPNKDQPQSKVA